MKQEKRLDKRIRLWLTSPEAILNIEEDRQLKELIAELEAEGFFVALVDRAPVFNKETLLHALYQSCQFPAYFGFNWDALEDCLKDFSWIIAEAYILIFQDYQCLKERSQETAEVFESIISEVASLRAEKQRKPLKVLYLTSGS